MSEQIDLASKLTLPKKPPFELLAAGFLSLILTSVLSTRFFPDFGPSYEKLHSQIDSIRRVAEVTEIEILVVRILLAAIGIAAIAIWFAWTPLIQSRAIKFITNHHPAKPLSKEFLNLSFAVIGCASLFIFLWVAIGGVLPILLTPSIVGEDGLIEYATAILFLMASVFSAYLFFTLHDNKRRWVHLILAAGFLLCFVEEISWGQRILNFETPDLVQSVNAQGEFNLHNSFGYAADHIFMVGVVLYGVIMPILACRSQFFHRLFDLTGLPIASLGLAAGFALVSVFHDWTVYAVLPKTLLRIGESREFLSGLCFLILMIEAKPPRRTDADDGRPARPRV